MEHIITYEEKLIFSMISKGHKIKNIANIIHLSDNRVKNIIKQVIYKLDATNKIDAMCKLIKMQMI